MQAIGRTFNATQFPHAGYSRVVAPSIGRASKRFVYKRRIFLLAALPIIDPVINQLNNAYQPSFGPFSMLQVVRCALLMAVLVTAGMVPRTRSSGSKGRRIPGAIGLCLMVVALHEFTVQGDLIRDSLIEYGQFAYWLTMWYLARSWITDPRSARVVIRGLVLGALITAGSVYYAYATGAHFAVYMGTGVRASAGWFISGKGIAGSLVAGALLAAYLGSRRRSWLSIVLAVLCLGAAFLTYARAGMVALAVSIAWLTVWSTVTASPFWSSWARRLVVASVCAALVAVLTIGTTDLVRRWSDMTGSGRLSLWSAALNGFLVGSATEQVFGHGFGGMTEIMETSVHQQLHTHSDVLDMLVVGGFAGMLILGLIPAGILAHIRSVRLKSPESAVAVGILLVLCCQMLFTGQFGFPDVMSFYLLGITAALACAPHRAPAAICPDRRWQQAPGKWPSFDPYR